MAFERKSVILKPGLGPALIKILIMEKKVQKVIYSDDDQLGFITLRSKNQIEFYNQVEAFIKEAKYLSEALRVRFALECIVFILRAGTKRIWQEKIIMFLLLKEIKQHVNRDNIIHFMRHFI